MLVDDLILKLESYKDKDAIIWRDQTYKYGMLVDSFRDFYEILPWPDTYGIAVGLDADFSPNAMALFLALIAKGAIIVPFTRDAVQKKEDAVKIAGIQTMVGLDRNDKISIQATGQNSTHSLFNVLKERGHSGLVLFSSGSSGKPKAVLHDFERILRKFSQPREPKRTLAFLLFDHIGGINTAFHVLSSGGCLVTVSDRSVDAVLRSIERHKVQVLPASPTFLNMILLSDAYREYDLSGLELVSYGTEVMPEHTLRKFHTVFPGIKLLQTYGLSELGIMRTKSRSSDSLWVKLGGEGFETRIVDGFLEIKADSAMLGYLNSLSPFTEDGWFKTGDAVEMDGEYMKILGRRSEMINVGGEKVYPSEIESVIMQMEGVMDATVKGEPNPIIGNIVVLTVRLAESEAAVDFKKRMREFCRGKLAPFKVPQKVLLADNVFYSDRFKKIR